jgi:lipid-A-disaccharide synthase
MKEIKQIDAEADFRYWGGDKMKAQGGFLVNHYKNIAFMGFWEVLTNVRLILKAIDYCKKDIVAFRPHLVIFVDYPGFNLRVAKFTFDYGFTNMYYISPQVWAWKASRVHQIKEHISRMVTILPFEQKFYKQYDF